MTKARQLFIRCDGSASIGFGHLIRCLSLAHMVRRSFHVIFVCRQVPNSIGRDITDAGFELLQIGSDTDFFSMVGPHSVVVLDGYQFDAEYQKSLRGMGCGLAVIDDLHNEPVHADLIINHAPGVVPEDYQCDPGTDFALGPDYALLRPAFLKAALSRQKRAVVGNTVWEADSEADDDYPEPARMKPDVKEPKEEVERIYPGTAFICFGGSDVQNLTARTAKLLLSFSSYNRIHIVTGAAYDQNIVIDDSDRERIKIHHSIGEAEMLSLMLVSDLAIVPASGVLMEVIAAGCGVISGMYTENQKEIYQGFKNLDAFIDAKTFEIPDLLASLEWVEENGIKPNRTLIDGRSGGRLMMKLEALAD